MCFAVDYSIKQGLVSVVLCRVNWMLDYQGMVCLAANQVWWTWEVEDIFNKVKLGNKTALKDYAKQLHEQIDDLVVKVTPHL